ALTRASRAFLESPPVGFTEVPILSPRGVIYHAEPGQEPLLESTRAALAGTGTAIELLDAKAVLAAVPVMEPSKLAAGLLEVDAQDIDVHALHQGFLRGLRRAGGVLRTGAELVGARRQGSAWTLTLADGSSLAAGAVVNAAGAWADQVGALLGAAPVGLEPRRRAAFTFEGPAGQDFMRWPVVCGVAEDWYFKPDAGQLLGSPANADPTVPHDVVPEELDIATGIWRIEQVSAMRIRRPRRTWAGLRSFVADGDLVIGWDPAVAGLLWVAGQGGYGIQTAAAASALAAALALRGEPDPTLRAHGVQAEDMSPSRPSLRTGTLPEPTTRRKES
ncbi:MAG: NAD(P)/FAD-dependent oxidoreductase, partial [Lautropia sp.]